MRRGDTIRGRSVEDRRQEERDDRSHNPPSTGRANPPPQSVYEPKPGSPRHSRCASFWAQLRLYRQRTKQGERKPFDDSTELLVRIQQQPQQERLQEAAQTRLVCIARHRPVIQKWGLKLVPEEIGHQLLAWGCAVQQERTAHITGKKGCCL